jgi:threonylcarbamoyladenosine tRNA methylthiotransferase MtaB
VTQNAVKKSRQLIKRIHRDNPTAKLVVSGCYATLNQQEATDLMGVDLIIGNQQKDQLVATVLAELNIETMPAMSSEPGESALFSRGRQRAFVKVQDGCRYRYTFCIVTIARGAEISRPITTLIEEINALHRQGIKEIILTGVHLGGYGTDLNSNLGALLEQILLNTEIPRIRLGSLEPWDLAENFFALFENPRMMPHLHLPLQSGSNSVLRRMARRCKTAEFATIVKQARAQIPNINITTDIIVGFPGETEQEWQESYDFIKQTGFGHIHIFSYSPRQGTKAATLPDPIRNEVKKQRSQRIHRLAASMKQRMLSANLGNEVEILWESANQTTSTEHLSYSGYTPNYLRVELNTAENLNIENEITKVKLQTIANHQFHCSTLDLVH